MSNKVQAFFLLFRKYPHSVNRYAALVLFAIFSKLFADV